MKKITSISFVAVMAAALIGCGSSDNDGAPPPTDKVSKQFESGPSSGADAGGNPAAKSPTEQPVSDK